MPVPQAVLLLLQTGEAGDISEAESCPGRGVEILQPEEVPVLVIHSIGEHHRPPPLHKVAVEVPCPWEPLLVGHLQPLSRLVGKYYFEKILLGDTKNICAPDAWPTAPCGPPCPHSQVAT